MKLVEEKVNISHDGEGAKCTRDGLDLLTFPFPLPIMDLGTRKS